MERRPLDLLDSVNVVRVSLLIHGCVKTLLEAWLGEQSVDILESESLGFCEKLSVVVMSV